jgi:tRNA threonylcarbamoyladenosine biosynthesis protein TsaE
VTAAPPPLRCPAERDTIALGERIGRVLRRGELLVLSGPLGAGKTVLVRGIAIGAGADPIAVRSPTFVLHHVYRGDRLTLHHLDLYRLGPGANVALLDIDDLLESGAVVVEWGELADLGAHAPVRIDIAIAGRETRIITLAVGAPPRIAAAWQPATAPT